MELKKITKRIFYYPHQPKTDRPMLAYIQGDSRSLAIDAGNSSDHVDEFYAALELYHLKKPNFTAITHWHWDHTFGMHQIHGYSIAHIKTNQLLQQEKKKLLDPNYITSLKANNEFIHREYRDDKEMIVALADIQFEREIILRLGGITARIFHVVSPHTEDTSLIYIPEEKILFLGDATSEDFSNNGFMDKQKLAQLIHLIERTDCSYCILGHEEPLLKPDLLSYLYTL